MKKLFDMNNPVMQFLGKAGNLMCLNVIFLICCIPVVTVGAALTAMHKVTQAMAMGEEPYLVRTFFRGFQESFKKATIIWIGILLFGVVIGYNYLVTLTYLPEGTAEICKWLLIFVAAVILVISSYLFHLIARYENTIQRYLINSAILAIAKLPKTVILAALSAAPFAMLLCSMEFIYKLLILWVMIGFALISYLQSMILRSVFRQFEDNQEET